MKNEKLMYTDSFGDTFEVFPKIDFYKSNNNLYVGLDAYDEDLEAVDSYCHITVNLYELPYLHSAIDLTFGGEAKPKFLEENGFGHFTGEVINNGFGKYPVFEFDEDKIREINPETFAEYAKAHGKDKPGFDKLISNAQVHTSKAGKLAIEKENER